MSNSHQNITSVHDTFCLLEQIILNLSVDDVILKLQPISLAIRHQTRLDDGGRIIITLHPPLLTLTIRVGSLLGPESAHREDAGDHGSRSITQSPSRRFLHTEKSKSKLMIIRSGKNGVILFQLCICIIMQ